MLTQEKNNSSGLPDTVTEQLEKLAKERQEVDDIIKSILNTSSIADIINNEAI